MVETQTVRASEQDGLDLRYVLRLICYHEAGHFVIADRFGAEPDVWLDIDGDKIVGTTKSFLPAMTADEAKLVAMAGMIAEYLCHDDRPREDPGAADIQRIFENMVHHCSQTDRDGIGAFDSTDIKRCLELVCLDWSRVEEVAEYLIEEYTPDLDPEMPEVAA